MVCGLQKWSSRHYIYSESSLYVIHTDYCRRPGGWRWVVLVCLLCVFFEEDKRLRANDARRGCTRLYMLRNPGLARGQKGAREGRMPPKAPLFLSGYQAAQALPPRHEPTHAARAWAQARQQYPALRFPLARNPSCCGWCANWLFPHISNSDVMCKPS